jgi:hypothetical protein
MANAELIELNIANPPLIDLDQNWPADEVAHLAEVIPLFEPVLPTFTSESLTVNLSTVTLPSDLIEPRPQVALYQTRSQETWDRIQRLRSACDQDTTRSRPNEINRYVEAETMLPLTSPHSVLRVHHEHESAIARRHLFVADVDEDPRESALMYLANTTLAIARMPACISESSRIPGSNIMKPVVKSLGHIVLSVEMQNEQTLYSGYNSHPAPKLVELARAAVNSNENRARNERMFDLSRAVNINKLIEDERKTPGTYKSLRHEIASRALMIAWEQSVIQGGAQHEVQITY